MVLDSRQNVSVPDPRGPIVCKLVGGDAIWVLFHVFVAALCEGSHYTGSQVIWAHST